MDENTTYTRTAITLHWVVALLIFGGFILGEYMVELKVSPTKLRYYSYHKWIGVTVFLLALVRILWRVRHPAPPLSATLGGWQRRAAEIGHRLLYLLLFLVPISGWLFSSSTGFPTVYLGLIQLPDLVPKDAALKDILKIVHWVFSSTLAVIVIGHVAAALKHHFVDRDDTLGRMIPWLQRKA